MSQESVAKHNVHSKIQVFNENVSTKVNKFKNQISFCTRMGNGTSDQLPTNG